MKHNHHGNYVFIQNIKDLRYREGLSQDKFAEAIGVKRNLAGAWEEGRSMPKATMLAKIAKLFEIEDLSSFITKPYDPAPKRKIWTNGVGDIEAKYRRLSKKNKEIVKLILESNP